MSKLLKCGVGLVVVLVGVCFGGIVSIIADPPAPDATLEIVPTGETHGGLNGYVLANPEAGGKTGVTMTATLQNFTLLPLSDSGGASDQTKLDGKIEHVKFPVWVVKMKAHMTAFAKADQVGDPLQNSYSATASFRLVYEFNPGGGTMEVKDTVTLVSNEIGPKQTPPLGGKFEVTDVRNGKKLDTSYRSECEGSIRSSRPEPKIEAGAHHLEPWTGTAVAHNETTGGLVVIIRPDGTNAEWILK